MSDPHVPAVTPQTNRRGTVIALILLMAGGFSAGWMTTSPRQPLPFVGSSPKLIVQPTELDLGQARPGHELIGTITLKNSGGGVLQIYQVRTGCACSSFHLDEKSLSPGQETQLTVTAEIRKEEQHLTFPVRISSNDPDAPEAIVFVRADAVPPPIRTEPASLDFPEVALGGNSPTQRLKLFKPDGKPWPASEPVVAKSAAGLVVAEPLCPPDVALDGGLILVVRPRLNRPLGHFEDMLSIRPVASNDDVAVTIRGNMVPLYVISPTTFFFDDVDPHGSKTIKRQLSIRRTDGQPVPKMIKFMTPPSITVHNTEIAKQAAGAYRIVEVILDPERIHGDLKDGKILLWLEGEPEPLAVGVMIFLQSLG